MCLTDYVCHLKVLPLANQQREKVYVLDQGKSLMVALSQDAALNRPVEAREHVRRMHELFFTLAPDKAAIESNINRAMYLADKSLYSYYRDWNEKGYYNRLISGNINQTVLVDSMQCDFDNYPYRITTFARQMIIETAISPSVPGHPLLPAEYGQVG